MAKKTVKAKPVKKAAKPVKKAAAPVKKKVAKPAKKAAKPAKKAAPVKKVVKPAKKAAKPAPAKKAAKPVAKKVVKPAKKAVEKKAVKKVVAPVKKQVATKPAKKVETKAAKKAVDNKATKAPASAKEQKKVVTATKEVAKKEAPVKEAPAKKETPKAAPVEKTPVETKTAAPKETVKTVEQQMQEAQTKAPEAAAPAAKGSSKEELFVPKYSLPSTGEALRPMRPKPAAISQETVAKPVANPIFVPPAPDGKPGIKFAPIANLERPKEKEKAINKSEEEDMNSKTSPRLAFNEGDDKKGVSVEAKLRALYAIQLIDSRIDKIHAMRGELPLEVQDLEDDIVGLETRFSKLSDELKNLTDDVAAKKQGIKDAEASIKKYKEQLNNVKNNREFDSLNKEIEFQELEIQLFNKKIKESDFTVTQKTDLLSNTEGKLKERKNDLKIKRAELDEIISSTEKEEKVLQKKSEESKKLIEERLLSAYERIRSGAPNKMAVVPIEREASAGSFIQLPPQKQLDVAARKRVIVDEHSGRILVDAELANEEVEKMNALLAKELK